LLAFTSVYFFESGLFNGLRPIQIKYLGAVSGCVRTVSSLPSVSIPPRFSPGGACRGRGFVSGDWEMYSTVFWFLQALFTRGNFGCAIFARAAANRLAEKPAKSKVQGDVGFHSGSPALRIASTSWTHFST
jgi:hypothetical protein